MNRYETERCLLKPAEISDADFFLELYNSPLFLHYIGDRKLRTSQDAANYIREKFLPQLQEKGFGNFVVLRKADGKKIGAVGIFQREGLSVLDIGFSFLPDYLHQGYGYETSAKLLQLAKEQFGFKAISAITTEDNLASQKLIAKLGLTFREMVLLPNEEVALRYFEKELK